MPRPRSNRAGRPATGSRCGGGLAGRSGASGPATTSSSPSTSPAARAGSATAARPRSARTSRTWAPGRWGRPARRAQAERVRIPVADVNLPQRPRRRRGRARCSPATCSRPVCTPRASRADPGGNVGRRDRRGTGRFLRVQSHGAGARRDGLRGGPCGAPARWHDRHRRRRDRRHRRPRADGPGRAHRRPGPRRGDRGGRDAGEGLRHGDRNGPSGRRRRGGGMYAGESVELQLGGLPPGAWADRSRFAGICPVHTWWEQAMQDLRRRRLDQGR